MYTLSYNLKRILKRKWRERINIKNVGKIKTKILRMDVIYGGLGGRGGGVPELTNKERSPSPILNFESPLTKSIICMCPMRNHCIAVRYFPQEKTTY